MALYMIYWMLVVTVPQIPISKTTCHILPFPLLSAKIGRMDGRTDGLKFLLISIDQVLLMLVLGMTVVIVVVLLWWLR